MRQAAGRICVSCFVYFASALGDSFIASMALALSILPLRPFRIMEFMNMWRGSNTAPTSRLAGYWRDDPFFYRPNHDLIIRTIRTRLCRALLSRSRFSFPAAGGDYDNPLSGFQTSRRPSVENICPGFTGYPTIKMSGLCHRLSGSSWHWDKAVHRVHVRPQLDFPRSSRSHFSVTALKAQPTISAVIHPTWRQSGDEVRAQDSSVRLSGAEFQSRELDNDRRDEVAAAPAAKLGDNPASLTAAACSVASSTAETDCPTPVPLRIRQHGECLSVWPLCASSSPAGDTLRRVSIQVGHKYSSTVRLRGCRLSRPVCIFLICGFPFCLWFQYFTVRCGCFLLFMPSPLRGVSVVISLSSWLIPVFPKLPEGKRSDDAIHRCLADY